MADLDPVFPRLLDLLLDTLLSVVRVSERLRHRLGFVVQPNVHEVTTNVNHLYTMKKAAKRVEQFLVCVLGSTIA